ncbi:hypothetical protein ACQZV8_04100 [Magnetococcales bacterium HHB-1]
MIRALETFLRSYFSQTRTLSIRIAGGISTCMEVDDPISVLTEEKLAALEPFEVELMLSSMFTPKEQEGKQLEQVLKGEGISEADYQALESALIESPPVCTVRYGEQKSALAVPEVVMSRTLRLLSLKQNVESDLREQLKRLTADDVHWCNAMAQLRHRDWRRKQWQNMVRLVLDAIEKADSFSLEKFSFFTALIRSRPPQNKEGLCQRLQGIIDSYREDLDHPVFNQQLEDHQATSYRSTLCGEEVKAFRLAQSHALLRDLEY